MILVCSQCDTQFRDKDVCPECGSWDINILNDHVDYEDDDDEEVDDGERIPDEILELDPDEEDESDDYDDDCDPN